MTLSQALDFLRYRMNEQGAANPYYADAEIYALISARAQTACAILGLIEDTNTSTTTVASTQAYDLPTDAVALVKLLYDGKLLGEMSMREWENEKSSGTTPEGEPTGYVVWNRQVLLIPIPSEAKTLTFYYEPLHPWITAGTGTIDLPSAVHAALMDGVLADMYAKAQNVQLATLYENKWTGHLQVTFPNFKLRESQRSRARIVIDGDTAPSNTHGVK